MNTVPFILLAISLPLLLGGCGEKPVAEVQPVEEKVIEVEEEVNYKELEISGNPYTEIAYHKGSPYTGKSFELYGNGKKSGEANWKDGKRNGLTLEWYDNGQKLHERNFKGGKPVGLYLMWHKNGQKWIEINLKDGNSVDGYQKLWNSKGEPVDSMEEAIEE